MYLGSNKPELLKAAVQVQVEPRSYEVATEDGKRFRRNLIYLRKLPENFVLVNKSPLLPKKESPSPSVPKQLQMETPTGSLPVMSGSPSPSQDTAGSTRELETMYRRHHQAGKLTDLII